MQKDSQNPFIDFEHREIYYIDTKDLCQILLSAYEQPPLCRLIGRT